MPRTTRRLTAWEEGPGEWVASGHVITGDDSALLDTGQTPVIPGLTVVRIRGFLSLTMTAASAIGDGFVGAFGIGICTATAFAQGVNSVPTPTAQIADENWLWMQEFGCFAQSLNGPFNASLDFNIDSKAMRKFDDGMVIYAAYDAEEIGDASLQLTFRTRMLLKLP